MADSGAGHRQTLVCVTLAAQPFAHAGRTAGRMRNVYKTRCDARLIRLRTTYPTSRDFNIRNGYIRRLRRIF